MARASRLTPPRWVTGREHANDCLFFCFIAITSKQDDHKTRQGHSVPVEWRSGVQVSCDKSNASCPHPQGAASLLRRQFLSVSFGFCVGMCFYTAVVSVSLHVRANCWPPSSPCTRECTAASPPRRSPRLSSQPASCPSSARTR